MSLKDRARERISATGQRWDAAQERLPNFVQKRLPSRDTTGKSWRTLDGRDSSETLANRDVYDAQQLDRQSLPGLRRKKAGYIFAAVLGVIVAVLMWVLYSVITLLIAVAGSAVAGLGSAGSDAAPPYYQEATTVDAEGGVIQCYEALDADGQPVVDEQCHDTAEAVPVPQWYTDAVAEQEAAGEESGAQVDAPVTLAEHLSGVSFFKIFVSGGVGAATGLTVGEIVRRRVDTANLMSRTDDINQHRSDQHLAVPEEIQRNYDWFPDAGAQSSVQVSSMLSHMMLSTKGTGTVELAKRANADILDDDGEVEVYEGEIIRDHEGEPEVQTVPMIDTAFGKDLYKASELFNEDLWKFYAAKKIPYNPGGTNRDKLGSYETVSDLIQADWHLPIYEPQRPAGAYIVDTAPVNTMVLAMTRAGKGQTYIEAVLDMWSRERAMNNFLANDPKGELLVKFYERLVVRGFQVIQFNLINILKTDIYNPLGLAAESAREGDFTKMAMYVENIAEVFFPVDGGDDPMWANAANNAFKRSAYGLIDYYLEEERELRVFAEATNMAAGTLEQRLDEMWGNVTLYNCYQFFVQLTSKKLKSPLVEFEEKVGTGAYEDDPDGEEEDRQEAENRAVPWEGKPELDMMTLFFNATAQLPGSTMRGMVGNTDNALRAMAGAEKMMASVYGIALTAMSFFTDPTISTLTSGRPSQNVDLGGLSFPRRFGVRLTSHFMKSQSLTGLQTVWSAYSDPMFQNDLGKDFRHEDMLSREGWARYYFKGIFETPDAWIKLEIRNPQSGALVRQFFFHFTKSFQLSLNGRRFVKEPVTGAKQIKNGVLREMRPVTDENGIVTEYTYASTQYRQQRLDMSGGGAAPELSTAQVRAIQQFSVRYSEQPKAVFLITPPHLTKYAKLVLILLKQLVDLNFDKSYMTKSNQKPLYKTRFMLDELGNLQSEGHGIAGFETMLSIGLGQEQQFTVILQTLQQLRDVYGESVDKIVQGNVSNIIYLKSTDDSMLETLEGLTGQTHRGYRNSKSVTQDVTKVAGSGRTEGKVSYTFSLEAEPLISKNDLLFLAPRNSVVLRAGDPPIWNRNETILPMAWRLHQNRIRHAGHEYGLQTIPTMSTAAEFDVRMNQPDFVKAVGKRLAQATQAEVASQQYRELYGYEDIDIKRLDPDAYADEVMQLIVSMINAEAGVTGPEVGAMDPEMSASFSAIDDDDVIEDHAAEQVAAVRKVAYDAYVGQRYAEKQVSREMLVTESGAAKLRKLDNEIAEAYRECRTELEQDEDHFRVNGSGELLSADGSRVYIRHTRHEDLAALNAAAGQTNSRTFGEGALDLDDLDASAQVEITADFYVFLASLESWVTLGNGSFERAMAREVRYAREDHA